MKTETATARKAYDFSKKRHEGQKSIDGRDYFEHPKKVYEILLRKGMDEAGLCAALLHDLIEDTNTTLDEIRKSFGEEVSFLVDGMTKVKGLGNYLKKFEEYAKKDKRLLLVKLADLEENLRVISLVNKDERAKVKEKYLRFLDLIKKRAGGEEKYWAEKILKKANVEFGKWVE